MKGCLAQSWSHRILVFTSLVFLLLIPLILGTQSSRSVPDHVPPKRSSQIRNGFGINSDMPRDPYLPLESLVVDPYVRCRFQVGPRRTI
jgi:hypothetical protein